MTTEQKLIQEGINYLRMMQHGQTIKELSEYFTETGTPVSEARIKEAIAAARAHKDASRMPPKVVLVEPRLKVHRDLMSGAFQAVREVHVELQKDVIIHYGEEAEHTFVALLPVKITVKRA